MGVNPLSTATFKQYFAKQIKMGGVGGLFWGLNIGGNGMTRQLVHMS